MFVKSDIFLIDPLRDRVFKRELCGEFVRKVTSLLHSYCPTLVKVGKKELGKDQRKKLKGIEFFFSLFYLEPSLKKGI